MHRFPVVVCERDLSPGSWKDLLEQTVLLPDPPLLIVTSKFADERLWAEALNLGAYDVLAKPFNCHEACRVVDSAWGYWRDHHETPVRARQGRAARMPGLLNDD